MGGWLGSDPRNGNSMCHRVTKKRERERKKKSLNSVIKHSKWVNCMACNLHLNHAFEK